MSDLKTAFRAIKTSYTKTDTIVLDLRDDKGEVMGVTSLVIDCSPNRRISEFLELRDKGLVSARKFQEIIFAECVVKMGDVEVRGVKSVPIDDDPGMLEAFKNAAAVTPKEFLQYQAENSVADFVLDNVEAVYSNLLASLAKERENDVHNGYIDGLRKKLEAAEAKKKEISEPTAIPDTMGQEVGPEPIPGVNMPPQSVIDARAAQLAAEAEVRRASGLDAAAAPATPVLPDEPTKF